MARIKVKVAGVTFEVDADKSPLARRDVKQDAKPAAKRPVSRKKD